MGHDVPRVSNPARGRWRASGSAAQQRLTRRWWCPPPIVPNHALIEVDRKRCLADAMGRADQPRLQVPNRAVRQWHHRRGAVPQGASERLHVLCSTVRAVRETWYRHATHRPRRCVSAIACHNVTSPTACPSTGKPSRSQREGGSCLPFKDLGVDRSSPILVHGLSRSCLRKCSSTPVITQRQGD